MDDYMFPAYTSPKIHSQTVKSSDSKTPTVSFSNVLLTVSSWRGLCA